MKKTFHLLKISKLFAIPKPQKLWYNNLIHGIYWPHGLLSVNCMAIYAAISLFTTRKAEDENRF